VSFRHAVEILLSGNASSLVASDKILGKNTVPRLQAPVAIDADDQTVLRQVIDYYHETLKRSPVALRYLEGQGIISEEALKTFRIGYADRTLGLRLPHKNRKEGAEVRGRLVSGWVFIGRADTSTSTALSCSRSLTKTG
jgi:hypothetical protein